MLKNVQFINATNQKYLEYFRMIGMLEYEVGKKATLTTLIKKLEFVSNVEDVSEDEQNIILKTKNTTFEFRKLTSEELGFQENYQTLYKEMQEHL